MPPSLHATAMVTACIVGCAACTGTDCPPGTAPADGRCVVAARTTGGGSTAAH